MSKDAWLDDIQYNNFLKRRQAGAEDKKYNFKGSPHGYGPIADWIGLYGFHYRNKHVT